MAKKFVKVLEWAMDKPDAEKKCVRLRKTMDLSPLGKIRYTIEPSFVSGKWAAVLFQK